MATNDNAQQQEGGENPEPTGDALAEVSALLQANPETLVNPKEADPLADTYGADEPAPVQKPQRQPDKGKGDSGEDDTPEKISEDGLGMEPGTDGGDADPVTASLKNLAEKAGVAVEDIYDIEVPTGDGQEPMTIGDLKDSFTALTKLETTKQTFEDTRTDFENEMIRARAELQGIIQLLPEVPAELIQRAATEYAQTQDNERQALFRIRPEWRDPEAFARAQESILESVSEYGFSKAELNQVVDHRLTKLLWDFHTLRERVREANAGAKRVRSASRTGRRKAADAKPSAFKQRMADATASGDLETKTSVIADLIKQG